MNRPQTLNPVETAASGNKCDQTRHPGGGAEHLIRIEGELRQCVNFQELWDHLANEPAQLLPFGQALVLKGGPRWRVSTASGLAQVQRDAPMVRWYERLVNRLWKETDGNLESLSFSLPRFADADDPCTQDSGLRHLLWVPLVDGGSGTGAGWLLARDQPWEEGQTVLAERLASAYAHGVSALAGRRPERRWLRWRPWAVLALVVLVAMLSLVRLPLVTLAPAEVVPRQPFVVAAPMAGVVDRVLVQPGARVQEGDALVQLVDTELRSDFEVAQRMLEVTRAKSLRLQQASVGDSSARHELTIARSEQSVAEAERDFAGAMLDKTLIRAEQSGVALYGDPRDWAGRPVAVGEAIMRVADPQLVEFRIKVPVADAVNLRENAPVRIYLDAAPLDPISARVQRAAYKAEADAAGIANFRITAVADDIRATPPRLGLRGTARIYGEEVSLFYYLLRRPIVALRQLTGI